MAVASTQSPPKPSMIAPSPSALVELALLAAKVFASSKPTVESSNRSAPFSTLKSPEPSIVNLPSREEIFREFSVESSSTWMVALLASPPCVDPAFDPAPASALSPLSPAAMVVVSEIERSSPPKTSVPLLALSLPVLRMISRSSVLSASPVIFNVPQSPIAVILATVSSSIAICAIAGKD